MSDLYESCGPQRNRFVDLQPTPHECSLRPTTKLQARFWSDPASADDVRNLLHTWAELRQARILDDLNLDLWSEIAPRLRD